jgi:hypothetical protein
MSPPARTLASEAVPVKTCGVIMPISPIDGCSADHWLEVKAIITEAVEAITDPTFTPRLVSDADDIGVIQKRIVQNVYTADMVICDVSGKNPNVMFELGMRLAFDKPVVIIKDDKTDYSFDTGIIEHLTYPRDLRFQKIVEFKKSLSVKTKNTYLASASSPDHSPFLKNFGKFQVASLSQTEVGADRLILSMLEDLQTQVALLRRRSEVVTRKERRDPASGAVILLEAVQEYLRDKSIEEPLSLLGSQALLDHLMRNTAAPMHYDTRTEFAAAVDAAVIACATQR